MSIDGGSSRPCIEAADKSIKRVRAANMHVPFGSPTAAHPRRHKDSVYRSLVTLPVIAAQVTSVSVGLVYVGIGRVQLALELDHHDTVTEQQHRVSPPRFHWQLVFEDGRTPSVVGIDTDNLTHFLLEPRHGIAPRPTLLA